MNDIVLRSSRMYWDVKKCTQFCIYVFFFFKTCVNVRKNIIIVSTREKHKKMTYRRNSKRVPDTVRYVCVWPLQCLHRLRAHCYKNRLPKQYHNVISRLSRADHNKTTLTFCNYNTAAVSECCCTSYHVRLWTFYGWNYFLAR